MAPTPPTQAPASAFPRRAGAPKRLSSLALVAALAAGLLASACVPLAVTGITAGALAAADRRTLGAQTDDQSIELKGAALIGEKMPAAKGVSITSYNRKVLLTGQVPDANSKARAQELVAGLPNVRGVHNELAVAARAGLGALTSDAAITTRVKAAFVADRDLPGETIKIVTEAGVVYLMGLVTRAEGDRAARAASRVSGVSRVVTVFEYQPG
jgi:osmotically-inducible protein OsmY